jgi:hypothetical protein
LSGTPGRVTLSGHVIAACWPTLRLLGLALLLGRILLSFLPPGEPGGHALRKLPATLAASLILGAGVLLGMSFFTEQTSTALGLAAAGLLVRWVTSPGGIVPRHELPRERWSWLARLVYLAALAPAFLAWPKPGEVPEEPTDLILVECLHRVSLLLIVVAVEHGLATARRAPLGRALFVLALSVFLWRENPIAGSGAELFERIGSACFGAGAAFALGWLRRADRRAALLAIACFVVGRPWDTSDGVVLVEAALLALVLCTPRASRAWIAKGKAIGLVLCIAPALRGMHWIGPAQSDSPLGALLRLVLVVSVLATAAWIARAIAARRQPEVAESRDALARGDLWLLFLLLAGTVISWVLPGAVGAQGESAGMQLVAPIAFLLAGCVSIRPERAA